MIPLRDENPTLRVPWVTYLLVGANVAVFLYQMQVLLAAGPRAYEAFVTRFALVPYTLFDLRSWFAAAVPAPLTLLTAMFVHADLFHLLGNLLYLWVFGDNVEDALGPLRYLAFYLVCGVGAAAAQVAVAPGSATPMVGASGAIAGILGAYLVLYPGAQVLTLVFLVFFIRLMYLPALLLLGLWFGFQLLSAAAGGGPGVAWYAHIGGFAAGVLLIGSFAGRPRRRRFRVH